MHCCDFLPPTLLFFFNLRHVYSLLHHFTELGKNKLLSLLEVCFTWCFPHLKPAAALGRLRETRTKCVDLLHPYIEGRSGVNLCAYYSLIVGFCVSFRGCQ